MSINFLKVLRSLKRSFVRVKRKKPVAKVCRFWRADTLLIPVYEA